MCVCVCVRARVREAPLGAGLGGDMMWRGGLSTCLDLSIMRLNSILLCILAFSRDSDAP